MVDIVRTQPRFTVKKSKFDNPRTFNEIQQLAYELTKMRQEFADAILELADEKVHGNGVKTTTTTVANTATETTIAVFTIPADTLNAGSLVILELMGTYSNASTSDDWTLRFKYGGVTLDTINRVGGNVTDVGWSARFILTFRTVGSSGTVYDHAMLTDDDTSYSKDSGTSHSVDTTTDDDIEVTVQWDNAKAGNTFSCTQAFQTRIP